ncbi:hypothetical protein PI125_g16326 [Phytophthora idaei]|nr:hypothetical protein PI125_g16326 [Phytophthora idaei]
MPPQDEWKALENKYATPPTYEDPRMRARRASNRERARSRLQQLNLLAFPPAWS